MRMIAFPLHFNSFQLLRLLTKCTRFKHIAALSSMNNMTTHCCKLNQAISIHVILVLKLQDKKLTFVNASNITKLKAITASVPKMLYQLQPKYYIVQASDTKRRLFVVAFPTEVVHFQKSIEVLSVAPFLCPESICTHIASATIKVLK